MSLVVLLLFTHTHTQLCLCSPSSTNWYRCKLGAKQTFHATHSPVSVDFIFGWCLAEGYRYGNHAAPWALVAREKLSFSFLVLLY